MNATLPTAIETYLLEAGFTATEMLVLRNLVEGVPLSLRELAVKTGKSTGVLDQSMKKLLRKEIAEKRSVNGHPKFAIHSLDAVVRWVKKDMQQRKEMLDRRHQNFEQFIASLKIGSKKPDVEYFHGVDGIHKLYLKLLESRQELLTFTPIFFTAEEDPLRAERVELFRKRQFHKIFQRVIAPDTPLSRRFQSRDSFEYRKTILLPEPELPLLFEKTVAGDYIACIHPQENTGCLFQYPELAKNERAVFESVWARAKMTEGMNAAAIQNPEAEAVPLKTRILSQLREFIVSRKSIVAFALFAVIAGVMTFGLYMNNRELNFQRIRETVVSIAATGALQINPAELDELKTLKDIEKPTYARVVYMLNLIRRHNSDIVYVYLIRPTADSTIFEFIADADGEDPLNPIDTNKDGEITSADDVGIPGLLYEVSGKDALTQKKFSRPVANSKPYTDKWGSFVTGYAPVFRENGQIAGLLAVDMWADKINEFSFQTFSPIGIFVALFLVFTTIRFSALNKFLLEECWFLMKQRKKLLGLTVIFCGLFFYAGFSMLIFAKNKKIIDTEGKKLMSIAATAASSFSSIDLNKLQWARDMKSNEYQQVFKELNTIRNQNSEITFAYIIRPLEQEGLFEFVADADSNFNLPQYTKFDIEDFSDFSESNENITPGVVYDDSKDRLFIIGQKKKAYGQNSLDQWGSFITGVSPIFNSKGETMGILALDEYIDKINALN